MRTRKRYLDAGGRDVPAEIVKKIRDKTATRKEREMVKKIIVLKVDNKGRIIGSAHKKVVGLVD